MSAVMQDFCAKQCDHSATSFNPQTRPSSSGPSARRLNTSVVLGQARVFIGFASASHLLFWVAST